MAILSVFIYLQVLTQLLKSLSLFTSLLLLTRKALIIVLLSLLGCCSSTPSQTFKEPVKMLVGNAFNPIISCTLDPRQILCSVHYQVFFFNNICYKVFGDLIPALKLDTTG